MRQFMSGVQDTLKDGLTTPGSEVPGNVIEAQFLANLTKMAEKGHVHHPPIKLAAASSGDSGSSGGGTTATGTQANEGPGAGRKKRLRKDSSIASTGSGVSRSWADSAPSNLGHPQRSLSMSFSAAVQQKKSLRRLKDVGALQEKQLVVFHPPIMEEG
jgi:hypothetical protein